jgi:hypothetical protein
MRERSSLGWYRAQVGNGLGCRAMNVTATVGTLDRVTWKRFIEHTRLLVLVLIQL